MSKYAKDAAAGRAAKLPPWTTDELLLALDLYWREPKAQSNKAHPSVIELSEVLRCLPLFPGLVDDLRFRNPQGVYMKLMNIRHIDPDHPGDGLKGGGQLEARLFDRYRDNREDLHRLAALVRSGATADLVLPGEDEDEAEHPEGRIVLGMHRRRERSQKAVKDAKARQRKRLGHLSCEACGINEAALSSRYGLTSGDLYECHHRIPLADLATVRSTRASDLAILCPTCHRAIHRIDPLPAVEAFALTVSGPQA